MTAPDLRTLIFDAEEDMRNVKDWAVILHDYLTEAAPIGEERQAALGNITGELLAIGYRLHKKFDAMFEAARGLP